MGNIRAIERSRPNYESEKTHTVSHTLPFSMIDILNSDADKRNISRSYLICAILAAYYEIPVPIVVPNNGKTKKAAIRKLVNVG